MNDYSNINCYFPEFSAKHVFNSLLRQLPGSIDASNPREDWPKVWINDVLIWLEPVNDTGVCSEATEGSSSCDDVSVMFHIHQLHPQTGNVVSYLTTNDLKTSLSFVHALTNGNQMSGEIDVDRHQLLSIAENSQAASLRDTHSDRTIVYSYNVDEFRIRVDG